MIIDEDEECVIIGIAVADIDVARRANFKMTFGNFHILFDRRRH